MEINFKIELLPQIVFMLILYLILLHTKKTHVSIKVCNIYTIRLKFSKLLVHSAHGSLFNESPVYTDILSFVSHRCLSSRNDRHFSAVRNMTPYKLAITQECIKARIYYLSSLTGVPSSRNDHHSSAVRTMTPYKLAIIWECIKVLNRRFDLVSSCLPIHHVLTVSQVRQAHRSI